MRNHAQSNQIWWKWWTKEIESESVIKKLFGQWTRKKCHITVRKKTLSKLVWGVCTQCTVTIRHVTHTEYKIQCILYMLITIRTGSIICKHNLYSSIKSVSICLCVILSHTPIYKIVNFKFPFSLFCARKKQRPTRSIWRTRVTIFIFT